jgi:NAD+ kinase
LNKVGIFLKQGHYSKKFFSQCITIFELLKESSLTFFPNETIPSELASYHSEKNFYDQDFYLSLGGDGTFLKSLYYTQDKPIFSVHLGDFGFLPEFSYEESLKNLLFLENLTKKHIKGYHLSFLDKEELFFNDAVIYPKKKQLISLNLSIQNETFTFQGDGIILSTPLGSTGYSLSAGGPILDDSSKNLILTPICQRSLNSRSLVFNHHHSFTLYSEDKICISFDGRRIFSLPSKTPISYVIKTKENILFKNADKNFFHYLKKKFLYGSTH